jgi:hypothetical protein
VGATQRWLLAGAAGVVLVGGLGVTIASALIWRAWRPSDGWRVEQDPSGFSMEVPRGWSVRPDAATGRVEATGPDDERVIAWPLYSPQPLTTRSASTLLRRLAPKLWPGARWREVEILGPSAVQARGTRGDRRAGCALAWANSPRGASATAYLLLPAASAGGGSPERLARIAQSVRLTGPPARAIARRVPHERWTDPVERAFSVEIPAGWRAEGGASRPNTLVVQAHVDARSPDGEIALYLGDAFPVYVEPNAVLRAAGIGPGGTYVDPMGHPNPVAAYAPGIEYALRAVLPARVGRFRVTRGAARPDVAARLARVGINQFDAGEAEYLFERSGRPRQGWALCITERVSTTIGGTWHVWRLFLVEAAPARFDEGTAAMAHLAASLQVDPDWAARQAQLTAAQSRILAEMNESVGRTIRQAYETRQSTLDEIHRRGADARREVDQLIDPETGRHFTVESGSRYYWVDPRGVVVGTETDSRPHVDFRGLTRLL